MDQQHINDISISPISPYSLYFQAEKQAIANRIGKKMLGAGTVSFLASSVWASATERSFIRTVTAVTSNSMVAMTAFAVCQEGIRAYRHGQHDSWNSFTAGGLTGAALARFKYGRGFHWQVAVLWAPICGATHWITSRLQLVEQLKSWLVQSDLLDVPHHHQQQQMVQQQGSGAAEQGAAPPHGQQSDGDNSKELIEFEDMSWIDKVRAVEGLRRREMDELHRMLREGTYTANIAGGTSEQQGEEDPLEEKKQRRWLWR